MINTGGLPGADLIETGLADLERGLVSAPALLVSIGAPRLESLGLVIPRVELDAEHRLYLLLQQEHGHGAHSQYNALVGRLVSFERALACAG
ncbi:MAG TPA: hypothetical protein VMM93_07795 [Vicinamibacterales bacterium]|nr:hypothetical protein [Vicinamibacterales bacterium]